MAEGTAEARVLLDRLRTFQDPGDAAAAAWRSLVFELDSWATAGQTASLWWRDDDAVDATEALRRLRAVSETAGVPVALAVVPARATADLADAVRAWPDARVLQHGFDHANHAPQGAKKTELAAGRPMGDMLDQIADGRARLVELFGDRALPVLVPPWNRISSNLVAALPTLGITGLSTFKGTRHREAAVVEVNTHIDLVNWRGRAFVGDRAALDTVADQLRRRRLGSDDPAGPTGLLTHHLDHEPAAWDFIGRFLAATTAHPAVRWLDAAAVFARATDPAKAPA